MSWFRELFRGRPPGSIVRPIQDKFEIFMSLLDRNNHILEVLSDMEEKSQGEYLFDVNYIRTSVGSLRSEVSGMVEDMIALGGEKKYAPLRKQYREIDARVEILLQGGGPVEKDDFTIPFDDIGRDRAFSVGQTA